MSRQRHNYKNLKIWKVGLEIAKEISDQIEKFPKHERYDLTSQMSRCSISIPSNISEGSARTDKSFNHFIDIALGSSFELGTQLLIAKHKKYIKQETVEGLEEKITEWQRMTMGFQNNLKF
ncbi:four helix bundle protein [Dokdonia sp.]|uniref:four helix bundle protein n=1 Tax=Dokdonia sp. TaxID=2024995 RepID=UPI003263510A